MRLKNSLSLVEGEGYNVILPFQIYIFPFFNSFTAKSAALAVIAI